MNQMQSLKSRSRFDWDTLTVRHLSWSLMIRYRTGPAITADKIKGGHTCWTKEKIVMSMNNMQWSIILFQRQKAQQLTKLIINEKSSYLGNPSYWTEFFLSITFSNIHAYTVRSQSFKTDFPLRWAERPSIYLVRKLVEEVMQLSNHTSS